MENNARFRLENGRIIRVNERPKVCFLTVLCNAGKYPERFDVVVFQPPPGISLEEGAPVTVIGDLSMRKPKEGEQGRWELQLIARTIQQGDAEKAPWLKGASKAPPKAPPAQEPEDDLLF